VFDAPYPSKQWRIINERRMSVLTALAPRQVLPNSSGSFDIAAASSFGRASFDRCRRCKMNPRASLSHCVRSSRLPAKTGSGGYGRGPLMESGCRERFFLSLPSFITKKSKKNRATYAPCLSFDCSLWPRDSRKLQDRDCFGATSLAAYVENKSTRLRSVCRRCR
jgi:hypothetical protein